MTPWQDTNQRGDSQQTNGECEEFARLAQLAHAAGVRRVMVIMAPAPAEGASGHMMQYPAVCQALEVTLRLLAARSRAEEHAAP